MKRQGCRAGWRARAPRRRPTAPRKRAAGAGCAAPRRPRDEHRATRSVDALLPDLHENGALGLAADEPRLRGRDGSVRIEEPINPVQLDRPIDPSELVVTERELRAGPLAQFMGV